MAPTNKKGNKKGRMFLFIACGFVVIALMVLVIGGRLAGWDIIGFFVTKYAVWIYVVIIGLVSVMGFMLWDEMEKRL